MDVYVPHEDDFLEESFPDDFVWSAATAAYQVEGGWNEGGMLVHCCFFVKKRPE